MAQPVLVGYDPKTRDHAPVHFGVELTRYAGGPLIIASVHGGPRPVAVSMAQSLSVGLATPDEDLVVDCAPDVRELQQELEAEGIDVVCRALYGLSVARALHETAEEEHAGLLVVGSSRRGRIGRLLTGSTAQRLLHGAPCPVAVVPGRYTRNGGPSTIGVAFVDTEEGHEALRGAHALARRAGARLRVITVVQVTLGMYAETESYTAGQRAKHFEDVLGEHKLAGERAARQAVAELGNGDVEVEIDALIGDPADVLADISEHLDLLVCGSRGYGPARAVLLGGVSRRLVDEARCPVIVLPRGVKSSLEALIVDRAEYAEAR